ncbi:nucleoside deaminase [Desulfobulbus alkaliphilus]|uniref:nucleoside deaminase n=1 Tax=Desulfobulbus alkaliphilus TaxID=869814 RepID=UPI001962A665|nr:nucleoside deaminase [Desulfobulbus alkaliphilus]MBM9537073.1 nucleoside deaminase [Desulfobulbus alkaliphilus]
MHTDPINTHPASPPHLLLDLPTWAGRELERLPARLPTLEARMAAVLHFARRNVREESGGPFAAGVFERDSGRVLVIGVNRVVPLNCSSAHAEIMALSLAQRQLGVYDLGGPGLPAHQLVVNWSPCAMCFGAVLWSGVRSLVIAGAGPELEDITGFDEGPMPPLWRQELANRGIELTEDILRQEALADFRQFARDQPLIYNARQGG